MKANKLILLPLLLWGSHSLAMGEVMMGSAGFDPSQADFFEAMPLFIDEDENTAGLHSFDIKASDLDYHPDTVIEEQDDGNQLAIEEAITEFDSNPYAVDTYVADLGEINEDFPLQIYIRHLRKFDLPLPIHISFGNEQPAQPVPDNSTAIATTDQPSDTATPDVTKAPLVKEFKPDSGNGVLSDRRYYSTYTSGIVVGTISAKAYNNALLSYWDAGSLDFRAGKGLFFNHPVNPAASGEPVQPSVPYKLDNQIKDRRFFSTVTASPKVVIARYESYDANEGSLSLDAVSAPYSDFTETESYQQFPGGIANAPYHGWIYYNPEHSAYGKVIRISRKKYSWFKNQCDIYLHKGGTIAKEVDATSTASNNETEESEASQKTTQIVQVPNVLVLTSFSENICRYAEDAARAMSDLHIEYTVYGISKAGEDQTNVHLIHAE